MQQGHLQEGAEGLAADLRHLATRRGVLALGLGAIGGRVLGDTACLANPPEMAGPFPADGSAAGGGTNALTVDGIRRSDIRGSFGGMSGTAAGLQVVIDMQLVDVDKACAPLAGYAVYLWHCDAAGLYSIYELPEVNYLRGVVVADAQGVARVTTIFPGCYAGRWPHLHFEVFKSPEVAVAGEAALLTSQLVLPQGVCASVYGSTAGYEASRQNFVGQTVDGDLVFADNTLQEIEAMTLIVKRDPMAGTTAQVMIGVAR